MERSGPRQFSGVEVCSMVLCPILLLLPICVYVCTYHRPLVPATTGMGLRISGTWIASILRYCMAIPGAYLIVETSSRSNP